MAKPSQPITEFISQADIFHQHIGSIYEPLDITRLQIRLMHILPGSYCHEKVEVSLSVVDLENNPSYDALSYTWGSLASTRTIILCGFPYQVTESQYSALRRLRLEDGSRTIWMDVTCINQADIAERNHQVSNMDQIYANAAVTRIWLGEPQSNWSAITDHDWNKWVDDTNSNSDLIQWMKGCTEGRPTNVVSTFRGVVEEEPDGLLKGALHLLKLLAEKLHIKHMPFCYLNETGELVHYRPFHHALDMVLLLLNSPWWTRVWVLQEACLSKTTPLVHVGSQQLSIRVFTEARRGWMHSAVLGQTDYLALSEIYYLSTFTESFNKISKYSIALETIGHTLGRLRLLVGLSMVNGRSAGDTRDFVYGIMGVINKDDRVPIDYSLSLGEVFSLASWYVFTKTTSGFDILKEAIGVSATNMPSWTVDWTSRDEAHFIDSDLFKAKEDTDQGLTHCFHHAGVLQVTGNQIDKIVTVLDTNGDPGRAMTEQVVVLDIISSWMQQLSAIGVLSDANLQTDYGDNDDDTTPVANFLTTIFREIKKNEAGQRTRFTSPSASSSGDDWKPIFHWLRQLKIASDRGDRYLLLQATNFDLGNDFRRSVHGSKLCTTEQGHLCMVIDSVEVGDYLYHVRGCCVPLALRPAAPFKLSLDKGESDGGGGDDDNEVPVERMIDPFRVVGACYLRGAMGTDGADRENEQVIFLV